MSITINPKRFSKFNNASVYLHSGNGTIQSGKACVMNWVNFLAGGNGFSDSHSCVDRTIEIFIIGLNDAEVFKEYRDELKSFAVRVLNTASNRKIAEKRMYMCADWAVRTIVPIALDQPVVRTLEEADIAISHAARLRACREIVDEQTADAATRVIKRVSRNNISGLVFAYAAESAIQAIYSAKADANGIIAGYADEIAAKAAIYAAIYAAKCAAINTDAEARKIWDESLSFLNKLIAVKEPT